MRLLQRRWLFDLDGTSYRGAALTPGLPLLSSAALLEACAPWDLCAPSPILQGVCSLRVAARRRSSPCAATRRRGRHAALGTQKEPWQGIAVGASEGSVRNALWNSYPLDRVLRKYARKIGVTREYSAHSMRATFITTALDDGASLEDIQSAAEHADPSTTKLYDRSGYNPGKSARFFANY